MSCLLPWPVGSASASASSTLPTGGGDRGSCPPGSPSLTPSSNLLDLNPQSINKLLTALNEYRSGAIFILDCLHHTRPKTTGGPEGQGTRARGLARPYLGGGSQKLGHRPSGGPLSRASPTDLSQTQSQAGSSVASGRQLAAHWAQNRTQGLLGPLTRSRVTAGRGGRWAAESHCSLTPLSLGFCWVLPCRIIFKAASGHCLWFTGGGGGHRSPAHESPSFL